MSRKNSKKAEAKPPRQVGPKNRIELPKLRRIEMPHADLVENIPERDPYSPQHETKSGQSLKPSKPKTTPRRGDRGVTPERGDTPVRGDTLVTPVAPVRDFSRVANSVVRDALAEGMFSGKSKQLYDYLYSVTRGAIVPRRDIRLPKSALRKGSDIRTLDTLDKNISHLKEHGLLEVITEDGGSHSGNLYIVYLPEEAEARTIGRGVSPVRGDRGVTEVIGAEKLPPVPPVETTPSTRALNIESSDSSTERNTFLNTREKTDDEALQLWQPIKEALGKVVGKPENWSKVGRVLAEELRKASGRTSSVTDPAAFLAEHLIRIFSEEKGSAKAKKQNKQPDQQPVTLEDHIKHLYLKNQDSGYEKEDLLADLKYRYDQMQEALDENRAKELIEGIFANPPKR